MTNIIKLALSLITFILIGCLIGCDFDAAGLYDRQCLHESCPSGYHCVDGYCQLSTEDTARNDNHGMDALETAVHTELNADTELNDTAVMTETLIVEVDDSVDRTDSFETCLGHEECNGLDDDCDGQIDEELFIDCYEGPSGTEGIGTCRAGTSQCQDGDFGPCIGQTLPEAETEDNADTVCDGLDNDCDGAVDQNCPCDNGESKSCYTGPPDTRGIGVCQTGIQTCVQNGWSDCTGDRTPGTETCGNPGQDDDCDGIADNIANLGDDCENQSQFGICRAGTYQCLEEELRCESLISPGTRTETCNGLDDDCDGHSDEDIADLTCGQGICRHSESACLDGQTQTCDPLQGAQSEICNGLDDDCDGVLDGSEGLTRQCGITDAGECTFGTETCTDAGAWVGCDAVVPQAEICNGLDDNCSGEVDDIAGEACFESENTCGPGTTECLAGIEICSSQYGGSDFSARMVHCGDNFTDSTNESENNRQWYRDLVDPYNAKDNLYVFAAESDYQVNVHVTEMSEPFDVFIMHLCGEDYFAGGTDSGFESHWSFDAMSGEEYYIIIDTFMRQTGAYRVNIECTP